MRKTSDNEEDQCKDQQVTSLLENLPAAKLQKPHALNYSHLPLRDEKTSHKKNKDK